MTQQFTTRSDPSDLFTIAYEGITVAKIDAKGDFHCYDKPKMIVALRGTAAQLHSAMEGAQEIQDLIEKHKAGGEPPKKGNGHGEEREP